MMLIHPIAINPNSKSSSQLLTIEVSKNRIEYEVYAGNIQEALDIAIDYWEDKGFDYFMTKEEQAAIKTDINYIVGGRNKRMIDVFLQVIDEDNRHYF